MPWFQGTQSQHLVRISSADWPRAQRAWSTPLRPNPSVQIVTIRQEVGLKLDILSRFQNLLTSTTVFAVIAMTNTVQSAPVSSGAAPEVHADRTITFRYRDVNAKSVAVNLSDQNGAVPITMTRIQTGFGQVRRLHWHLTGTPTRSFRMGRLDWIPRTQ